MSTEKKATKWRENFIKKPKKKKRTWKAYVILYIIGYIISLCYTGIPNLIYLIPMKINAISLSLFGGYLYYQFKQPKQPNESNNLYIGKIRGNCAIFAILVMVIWCLYIVVIHLLFTLHIISDKVPFMH
ncbi:hypothetical protein HBE96_04590 [Clostridium sp. P21]|uniref:Uncharacterized protein n=1 Tax=Clostridium muellerianum TaxID=2716538 RepID=A0A7Y0HLJ4_9CLOT|nr:hypothetical protein [Clostridium muellerianum]NMM61979.1 hypothetical protein [Clostridium muellerianum]